MTELRPVHRPAFIGSRENQIAQLAKRYSSSYKLLSGNAFPTSVILVIEPTDPDFPFDVSWIKLKMNIPKEYPDQPAKITILDQDIPRAFAVNLERGFDEYASTVKTTLVRQLAWLDKNLEQLLSKPPTTTPTVRFVSHRTTQVAPALPDHFIKAATTAAVRPSTSSAPPNKVQKENNSTEKENNTDLKHSSSITNVTDITTTSSSLPSNQLTQSFTATDEELAAAFGRRSREINHLSARLGKSFKMSKSDRSLLFVSVTLNDPGFTHFNFFDDNILKLRYHVPLQYPIAPCYIEIENKNIGNDIQNHIIHEFNYHIKLCPDYTLFEHLNWLHRHIESILNKPPPADLSNPTTPLLRQIRSPPTNTNHANPSKSISAKTKQNVSIFKDDQVKKKVIIVNDPNFTSPHTITTNEGSSSNSNNRESIESTNYNENADSTMVFTSEDEDEEGGGEAEVNKSLNVSEQLTVRRGTEIRLMKPQLDNITFFRCTSLYLLVKCNRCKSTIDIENLLPIESDFDNNHNDDNKGKTIAKKNERITSCSTCHSIIGIKFYSELIHYNSPSLGLLQLSGCKAFDMLTSTFMGSCESCFEDLNHTLRLAPFERPITVPCYVCHVKMTVALNEYKFIHIGEDGQSFQIQPEVATMKLKKKKKNKEELLTVGQPLPNEGTCSHYTRSKRWFRFACCGKLYPCDVCHDKEEDHTYEMATRHVCGLCSKEQNAVGNKPCQLCGYEFDKSHHKGTFWNGGEGVRNQSLMDRNETRKHRGKNKTTSKKQDRVGIAAKIKRENTQNPLN